MNPLRHLNRFLDNTDPTARFWSRVAVKSPGECWVWTGQKTKAGYGQLVLNGKRCYAHRFMFEAYCGSIPDKWTIDHICRNPSCVNPDHLRVCTQGQNNCNRPIGKTNTSGFKGVGFIPSTGRWRATIVSGGKQTWLGSFDNPTEAHEAFKLAARKIHGEFANFGGCQ